VKNRVPNKKPVYLADEEWGDESEQKNSKIFLIKVQL
jgi:hypothetical protein